MNDITHCLTCHKKEQAESKTWQWVNNCDKCSDNVLRETDEHQKYNIGDIVMLKNHIIGTVIALPTSGVFAGYYTITMVTGESDAIPQEEILGKTNIVVISEE